VRIGIVGAAGTGKTTLAEALGEALGAPLIDDPTYRVLEEEVGRPSWSGIRDTRLRRAVRLKTIRKKIAAEESAEAFVSDKTVMDYAAYWVKNQSSYETLEETRKMLELCRAHVPRYDVCVFLPFREDIEFSEHRSNDPIHNLHLSLLKRGILVELGATVVEAPYTFGEDIHAWIERWLRDSAGPAAPKKRASGKKKTTAKKKGTPKKKAAKKKAAKKKVSKRRSSR
jgi:predicted ATPase